MNPNGYAEKKYPAGATGTQEPLYGVGGIQAEGANFMSLTAFPTQVGQVFDVKVQRTRVRKDGKIGYIDCGTAKITASTTVATNPEGETYDFPNGWAGGNANFRVVFTAALPAPLLVAMGVGE